MDIRIKTTDYQMTPDVATYLEEKIALIEKHLGSDAALARCEVEVGLAAGNQRHGANMWFAEFNLILSGNGTIHATNHASNVNTAIDDAKEEVLGQIHTQKQVHRRLIRQGGALVKRMIRFGAEE